MAEEVDYDAGRVLEALNDKVDRDFGNVPSNFVNFAKYSKNVTNCITEIPQDIKLELNEGTLTLKAGSKVYIPNGKNADGSLKFDEVVIPSDKTTTRAKNRQETYVYHTTNGDFNMWRYVFSGDTAPTLTDNYALWYDTANNLVKHTSDKGATWISCCSLPICLATSNTTQITSIDQVFNGFGYIGSTVFALPGVKGLIPNGRNADGTLRNIEYTTQNVLLYTFGQNWSERPVVFSISKEENEVRLRPSYYFFEQSTTPSIITASQWLNTESNLLYQTYSDAVSWSNAFLRQAFICGSFFVTSEAKVSNFNYKTAFRAVDYNDKETVTDWGMPKNELTVLTPPSSGVSQVFTAPTNGYFVLSVMGGSQEGYFLWNLTRHVGFHEYCTSASGSSTHRMTCWACKGDQVDVYRQGVSAELYFVELQGV